MDFILGWFQFLGVCSIVMLPIVALYNVLSHGKLNVTSREYDKR